MTKKNDSKEKPALQPPSIGEKHVYNRDGLDDFLSVVFHTELYEDENILCWMTNSIPGYPITDDQLLSKIHRVPLPKALYFGTATCTPDPKDGKLYNRKALFSGLHVVVLDDIGTKVPIDSLPADLEPTYIIESSEGNYQYGYVLDEPVRVLEHAEALIQLVYDSGFTDAGGKMATKLVRLPDGVNGKAGERGKFHVKLCKANGPYWTPDDLLEVLDLGTTWDEILKDTEGAIKQRASQHVGLTPWSPIVPKSPTLDGLVDPVLEWLYDKGLVKQETNEWVTILCPWADQHTTAENTAGYSPMGRGSDLYVGRRNFHCFHEHCKGYKAGAFLEWVAANSGPQAAITDHAGELLASYAYDPINDGAWKIKDTKVPKLIAMQAMGNLHPNTTTVYTYEGKQKQVKEVALWRNAPNRVTVWGRTYDPSTEAAIIVDDIGHNYINTFTRPNWGEGAYDAAHIERFIEFMMYLIPESESYEYFMNWMTAKVHDMGFRGPAVLMIASAQGTGRTTFSNMLSTLFGAENVEHVPFDSLVGRGAYNDWLTSPIIVTDETLSMSTDKRYFKVYEGLKEIIDILPKMTRINPKYGKQFMQRTYSSYLMFSNHANAMAIAHNDRRFYVLENPTTPASGEFFTELHKWLDERDENGVPVWAQHVWRWFMQQKPDLQPLLNPAPLTFAKINMADASKTPLQVAVEAVFEALPTGLVPHFQMIDILRPLFSEFGIEDNYTGKTRLLAIMRDLTTATNIKLHVAGSSVRLRLISSRLSTEQLETFKHAKTSEPFIEAIELIQKTDLSAVRKHVEEALISHDR